MYFTLQIDADPTSWQLTNGIGQALTFSAPEVLPVYHPLLGELVLSPRSVGSAVFLEFAVIDPFGTRPNGLPVPGQYLYVPSPTGPDVHSSPPNLYILTGALTLAALKEDIITAMTRGTFLTVKVKGGEVVINGAAVPFVVIGPEHS